VALLGCVAQNHGTQTLKKQYLPKLNDMKRFLILAAIIVGLVVLLLEWRGRQGTASNGPEPPPTTTSNLYGNASDQGPQSPPGRAKPAPVPADQGQEDEKLRLFGPEATPCRMSGLAWWSTSCTASPSSPGRLESRLDSSGRRGPRAGGVGTVRPEKEIPYATLRGLPYLGPASSRAATWSQYRLQSLAALQNSRVPSRLIGMPGFRPQIAIVAS
jgi:hypothetical protein